MEEDVFKRKFAELYPSVFISDDFHFDNGKCVGCGDIMPAPGKNFYIFKYMPFSYLYEWLEKPHKICFVSPTKWSDPFEHKLYMPEKSTKLACFCCTSTRSVGEESAWKTYSRGNGDMLIKVTIDFDKLLKLLPDLAGDCGLEFYIEQIRYLNRDAVKDIYKKASKKNSLSVFEQVSILGVKRKAFVNEGEIRIFAVPKDHQTHVPEKMFIEFEPSCIAGYMIEPLNPEIGNDENYDKLQTTLHSGVKTYLEGKNPGEVNQSQLYNFDK